MDAEQLRQWRKHLEGREGACCCGFCVVEAARTGQLEEWSVEKHLCHRLRGSLTFVSKSIRLCCGLRKRKYCGGVRSTTHKLDASIV